MTYKNPTKAERVLISLIDNIDSPVNWPRWLRRLFLLTLPLAILCWLAVMASLVAICLVIVAIDELAKLCKRWWK